MRCNSSSEWIKQMMNMTDNSSGMVLPAVQLTLKTEIEEFEQLRIWLQKIALKLKLPEKITSQLMIAADEVFSNIAAYAYPGTSGMVTISAEQNDSLLQLTFADTGRPFDPLRTAEPDVKLPLEQRKIGGLGIFVVKKLMDKVEYRRENDRNILILTKHIPEAQSCS